MPKYIFCGHHHEWYWSRRLKLVRCWSCKEVADA